MIYSRQCPCKGCDDRHASCHNECEKYKEWKASAKMTTIYSIAEQYASERHRIIRSQEQRKGQYCRREYRR